MTRLQFGRSVFALALMASAQVASAVDLVPYRRSGGGAVGTGITNRSVTQTSLAPFVWNDSVSDAAGNVSASIDARFFTRSYSFVGSASGAGRPGGSGVGSNVSDEFYFQVSAPCGFRFTGLASSIVTLSTNTSVGASTGMNQSGGTLPYKFIFDRAGLSDQSFQQLGFLSIGPTYGVTLGASENSGVAGTASMTFRADFTLLVPRQGDANFDEQVDLTDFTILASNFNTTGRDWFHGDFNNNGSVDLTDFTLLAGNFNKTGQAADAASPAAMLVPEPTFAGALVSLMLIFYGRRRSRPALQ